MEQPNAVMTTPGGPPHPALGWLADDGVCRGRGDTTAELPALAGMLADAHAHGWAVEKTPGTSGWRVTAPDRSAAVAYSPPEDLGGAGAISAYDPRRTLALTGVDAAQAADILRLFLGWPGRTSASGRPGTGSGGPVDCCAAAAGGVL